MNEPLRVLAWPALTTPNIQPYISQLYAPMSDLGVEVEELSKGRVLLGAPDLVHAHWPDSLLAQDEEADVRRSLRRLSLLLWVLKLRGIPLLWTVHNLHSHEQRHPELEERLWSTWTSRLTGFLSLTEGGLAAARERFPALREKAGFVVPHGHYREAYPKPPSKEQARAELGLSADARMALFFGLVRPYKNVPSLVRTFRELSRDDDVLLVAGRPNDDAIEREVRKAAGEDARVRLRLEHVPDADTSTLFAAADLVVLPFSEVLNSGSALLALSLDRPVLVPSLGALLELRASAGEDWVRTYEGELSAELLDGALESARTPPVGRPNLRAHEWPRIVERTIDVYRELRRR